MWGSGLRLSYHTCVGAMDESAGLARTGLRNFEGIGCMFSLIWVLASTSSLEGLALKVLHVS